MRCYGGNIYKEGFSAQFLEQASSIKNTIIEKNFISIMEIGFHAGHSAEIILECPKTKLISFDINQYHYTEIGERFITNNFKNKQLNELEKLYEKESIKPIIDNTDTFEDSIAAIDYLSK